METLHRHPWFTFRNDFNFRDYIPLWNLWVKNKILWLISLAKFTHPFFLFISFFTADQKASKHGLERNPYHPESLRACRNFGKTLSSIYHDMFKHNQEHRWKVFGLDTPLWKESCLPILNQEFKLKGAKNFMPYRRESFYRQTQRSDNWNCPILKLIFL